MAKYKVLCYFLSILLFCSSCGTAYIVTDKGNDIYINGVKKGTERIEVKRTGGPKKIKVDIKQGNKIVNSQKVRRTFTVGSIVITLIFGLPGFIFGRQYPESTYVKGKKKSNESGESIWSKPPEDQNKWNN